MKPEPDENLRFDASPRSETGGNDSPEGQGKAAAILLRAPFSMKPERMRT